MTICYTFKLRGQYIFAEPVAYSLESAMMRAAVIARRLKAPITVVILVDTPDDGEIVFAAEWETVSYVSEKI